MDEISVANLIIGLNSAERTSIVRVYAGLTTRRFNETKRLYQQAAIINHGRIIATALPKELRQTAAGLRTVRARSHEAIAPLALAGIAEVTAAFAFPCPRLPRRFV